MGSVGRTTGLPLEKQWGRAAVSPAPYRQRDLQRRFLRVGMIVVAFSVFFALTCFLDIYRSALNAVAIAALIYTIIILLTKDSELFANPFHPLSVLIIIIFLNYGFRALTLEALRLQSAFVGSPLLQLPLACFLMSIYLALCYWGYRIRLGLTLARSVPLIVFPKRKWTQSQWVLRAYFLCGVGLLGKVVLIANGVNHTPTPLAAPFLRYFTLIGNLALFSTFAFMAVLGLVLTKQVSPIWLAPLACVEISVELLTGERLAAFMAMIYVLVGYSYLAKPIRWRYVLAGIAFILFAVVPLSYVWQNAYTEVYTRSKESQDATITSLGEVVDKPNAGDQQMKSLARFGELDMLLSVLDRVPRIYPYQEGGTFIPYLIAFPIPRFLWPSKPLVVPHRMFAILFADDVNKSIWGGNTPIGAVGELYFNFGYLGLVFCPIFGIVIRFLWERWKCYVQLESAASLRIVHIITEILPWNSTLVAYFTGMILGPLVIYGFMILFYGRLPDFRRMSTKG